MSTILVTGGAGFIGAAIVEKLGRRGDSVVAFDLRTSPTLDAVIADCGNVVFAPGDIIEWPHVADTLQRHRPEIVIHCAAVVGVVNSLASPVQTMRVNVEGSLNLLNAMRMAGCARFINISTEEVYGPFNAAMIDESHPCLPQKPYGISKFAVEQLALDFGRQHGIEAVNLRVCWVYGATLPRSRAPKIFVDAAIRGQSLHLAEGGDFRVDHTYIDDVVVGVLLAADASELSYDTYNIATGDAPSLSEIVAIVRDLVPGADLSIGPGNYFFAPGIETVRKGAFDISRARADLGYEPQYDVRRGLEACIALSGGQG